MMKTAILFDMAKSKNAKLEEKYKGPYKVYKQISPSIFDLKTKYNKMLRNIHIS